MLYNRTPDLKRNFIRKFTEVERNLSNNPSVRLLKHLKQSPISRGIPEEYRRVSQGSTVGHYRKILAMKLAIRNKINSLPLFSSMNRSNHACNDMNPNMEIQSTGFTALQSMIWNQLRLGFRKRPIQYGHLKPNLNFYRTCFLMTS